MALIKRELIEEAQEENMTCNYCAFFREGDVVKNTGNGKVGRKCRGVCEGSKPGNPMYTPPHVALSDFTICWCFVPAQKFWCLQNGYFIDIYSCKSRRVKGEECSESCYQNQQVVRLFEMLPDRPERKVIKRKTAEPKMMSERRRVKTAERQAIKRAGVFVESTKSKKRRVIKRKVK